MLPSKKVSTGSEVIAYCSSCKMDLAATVVAMVGAQIIKVFCKTCRKERAFKAAKGVADPAAAVSTTSKGTTPRAPRATTPAIPVSQEWHRLLVSAGPQAPRIPYIPTTTLAPGMVVQHPQFGAGVVTKLHFPNKAEIVFENDIKTLVHSLKP